MQVGRFAYLAKRQTGFPRQLETLAPCFAGFLVLAAGSLKLRLRALHGGASIPCRIVRHPVQTIPREPVASVTERPPEKRGGCVASAESRASTLDASALV
jgi:hypothetical protein